MADFTRNLSSALRTLPTKTHVEAAIREFMSPVVVPNNIGSGIEVDDGQPTVHSVKVTFDGCEVPLVDEAGVVAYGSKHLFTFPQGTVLLIGANADLALAKDSTGVNADWDGDVGVGTAACDNNATLTVSEDNILPTTATPQAVAGETTADMAMTASEHAVLLDGTTTAIPVYFNILVDDADHDVTTTPCNILVTGTIEIFYAFLGDR